MPVIRLKEALLEKIAAAAQKTYNQKPDGLEIGFPPNTDLGHFAVACFPLAKQFRSSPVDIAKKLAENILPDDVLQKVTATGPYLNLTLFPGILFGDICSEIFDSGQQLRGILNRPQ